MVWSLLCVARNNFFIQGQSRIVHLTNCNLLTLKSCSFSGKIWILKRRLLINFLSLRTAINCQKVVKKTLLRDKLISYQFMCTHSLIQRKNFVLNSCPNHQSDQPGSLIIPVKSPIYWRSDWSHGRFKDRLRIIVWDTEKVTVISKAGPDSFPTVLKNDIFSFQTSLPALGLKSGFGNLLTGFKTALF